MYPTNSPNAAHMHRCVPCYTLPQKSTMSSLLLLRVRNHNIRRAANSRAALNWCIGNGNIAEVVLADCLDGVCVCSMALAQYFLQDALYNPRTDSTDESEEGQSGHDVLRKVRLAGTVESGCRTVLLVVVRRLGHAAYEISARPYKHHIYKHSPSDRHLEGCILR